LQIILRQAGPLFRQLALGDVPIAIKRECAHSFSQATLALLGFKHDG
jgi:hypothetical protein